MFQISPTKLQTWQKCQYQYFLKYIERWEPQEEPVKFAKGNFIHAALEAYYQERILQRENPEDTLKRFIMDSPNSEWAERLHPDTLLAGCNVLSRYLPYAVEHDRQWEFLKVEEYFESYFRTPAGNEFKLNGYADVIARHRETKKIWTWDHKFTSRFWNPLEITTDIQQPLYLIGIRQALKLPITGIFVNQIKSYEYKDWSKVTPDKLFRREVGYRTDQELRNILRNTGQHVDTILSKQPTPINFARSLERDCNRKCDLADLCTSRLKGHGSGNFYGDGAPYNVKQVLDG